MFISVDVPGVYPPDPLLTLPMYRSLYLTCQSGTFLPPVFPLSICLFFPPLLSLHFPICSLHLPLFLPSYPFHQNPLTLPLPIVPCSFSPSLQTPSSSSSTLPHYLDSSDSISLHVYHLYPLLLDGNFFLSNHYCLFSLPGY